MVKYKSSMTEFEDNIAEFIHIEKWQIIYKTPFFLNIYINNFAIIFEKNFTHTQNLTTISYYILVVLIDAKNSVIFSLLFFHCFFMCYSSN